MQQKLLTQQQQLDRLRRLQYKFEIELQVPQYKFRSIIEKNPNLIYVEPTEFSSVVNYIKNEYFLTNDAILHICTKLKSEHFNVEFLSKKQNVLYSMFKLGKSSFGRGLVKSCRSLDMTNEQIQAWIEFMKENFQVDNQFLIKSYYESNFFGVSDPHFFYYMDQKCKYLDIHGIGPEQYNKEPQLFNFNLDKLDYKFKLAYLNGLTIEEFIDKKYLTSPEKIYARMMAQRNGEFPFTTIYLSEKDILFAIGKSSNDLVYQYPFDAEAISLINNEFHDKFPELDEKIYKFFQSSKIGFNELTNSINAEPEKYRSILNKTTKQEEQPDKINKRTSRITRLLTALSLDEVSLDSLKNKLNIDEFDEQTLKLIIINMNTLEQAGFSKNEIMAHPASLMIDPNKLTVRAKLALINNCSHEDFLSSYYSLPEETVYPRTRGAQLFKKDGNPAIYSATDQDYTNVIKISTSKLEQVFKLDNKALEIIDNLFNQKIETQNNDENEQ